ncbi:MAG: hypothetical protein ACLP52_19070 [Streptosporangiaceae bacterium]
MADGAVMPHDRLEQAPSLMLRGSVRTAWCPGSHQPPADADPMPVRPPRRLSRLLRWRSS